MGTGSEEWGVPGMGGAGVVMGYMGGCQRGLGVIPGDCGRSQCALEGLGENWAAGGLRGDWGIPDGPGETGGRVPVGTGGVPRGHWRRDWGAARDWWGSQGRFPLAPGGAGGFAERPGGSLRNLGYPGSVLEGSQGVQRALG